MSKPEYYQYIPHVTRSDGKMLHLENLIQKIQIEYAVYMTHVKLLNIQNNSRMSVHVSMPELKQ